MEGEPLDSAEDSRSSQQQQQDCSFVWDEASQLYYHAGTGFYHDPNGGWYYSSRDGVYYKFEDGNYVPLEFNAVDESDTHHYKDSSSKDESCSHGCADGHENSFIEGDVTEGHRQDGITPQSSISNCKCEESPIPENPPPPSAWLEDTLIELYLSNYSAPGVDARDDARKSAEACDGTDINQLLNEESDVYELEEGEWIPEDGYDPYDSIEGFSEDEESWRAQYGQVTQSREELMLDFQVVDLWDWAMIREAGKDGKGQVARLVGRLVKQTVKLHPSVPAGGSLLKTAQICQVSFDLVRVRTGLVFLHMFRVYISCFGYNNIACLASSFLFHILEFLFTGQVYKLRSPSKRYLASLSSYDSSNPTKDWGFPELSVDEQCPALLKSKKNSKLKVAHGAGSSKKLCVTPEQHLADDRHQAHRYRDRAAERRTLHGGFGFGPGQKNSLSHCDDKQSSPPPTTAEEAAAESMNMTFGAGSYARKVLESMGWKEGEALGGSTKGLLEPIRAVRNVGSAGLGWPQGTKHE